MEIAFLIGYTIVALAFGGLIGMSFGEAREARAWRDAGESGQIRNSGKRRWHVIPDRIPPWDGDEDFYHDAFTGR